MTKELIPNERITPASRSSVSLLFYSFLLIVQSVHPKKVAGYLMAKSASGNHGERWVWNRPSPFANELAELSQVRWASGSIPTTPMQNSGTGLASYSGEWNMRKRLHLQSWNLGSPASASTGYMHGTWHGARHRHMYSPALDSNTKVRYTAIF